MSRPGSSTSRVRRRALQLLVILGLLSVWEAATRSGIISPLFASPPTLVAEHLYAGMADGSLWQPTAVTLYEVAVTLLLVILIGTPLGYLMWRFGGVGAAYESLLASLFASPVILLFPLFFVVLGRGRTAVIAQGILLGGIPVVLYTYRGLRDVPRALLDTGRSLGLSGFRLFRHISLPSATGTIFTGLRLGTTFILVGVIAVEYLGQTGGLGTYVANASLVFDTAAMYTGVVLVILLTSLVLVLTYQMEKWVHQ